MLKTSILFVFLLGVSICSANIEIPDNSVIEQIQKIETVKHNPINKNQISVSQPLNILVWNIYKQGKTNLIPDLQKFSTENDILILQESHLTESFEKTIQSHPLSQHHFVTAPSFSYRGSLTGVSTTTRFDYLKATPLKSPVWEPILKTPKMSLYLILPVLGTSHPLMIANVHGINFVGQSSFSKHMQQVFDMVKTHQGPVVLAGDFNTRNKARTELVMKLARETGLKLVNLENDKRRTKLDLVLVRGVQISSAELVNDINSSDHPPLQLTLSVPNRLGKE